MAMWGVIHGCNENGLDSDVPLAGIIPYDDSYVDATGVLVDGWVWCDGNVITDVLSPFVGENTPLLNGTTDTDKRFLLGSSPIEITGLLVGSPTHGHTFPQVTNIDYDNSSTVNWYASLTAASSIPKYYEVKFMMRIR
jgi:hypothetical protein